MATMSRSDVLHRIAREPLARFFAAGALIFAADRALAARPRDDDPRQIVISDGFVEGLRARHRERTGSEPTPEEEEGLVRGWARDEALEREARAAALDAGDAIVRRRLVQKIEFVIAGSVEVPEPGDDELRAWVEANRDALRAPARTTLEHVFFSRQERGARAEDDARAALAMLASSPDRDAIALGDPFLAGHAIGPATDERLATVLGPGVPARIAALAPGAWAGPIEGAFGVHLVRVRAREPGRTPALAEVRERARAAWIEERRAEETERELARIVAQYEVVRVREDAP